MNIRMLEQRDLLSAMHLVWEVFAENTAPLYSPEGVAEFQRFIKIDRINELYSRREMYFWGAYEGTELRGVGAMYQNGHISLLDVKTAYHHQGIGRALFEAMKQFSTKNLGLTRLTVHSAPNAVDLYQSFGFYMNAQEQIKNGIRFVPMDYVISSSDIKQYNKKNHTGLIIGIIVAAVIIIIIVAAFVFRALANVANNRIDSYSYGDGNDDSLYDDYDYYEDEDDYTSEEDNSGIESIPVYEAGDLSYTIESKDYFEEEYGTQVWMCMDIEYPQLSGLDSEHADEINQILEDCAMEMANTLYLSPSEEFKGYLLEQEYAYIGSQVRYKVTYMTKDIICVVFQDNYVAGTTNDQYYDLRTKTINLKEGTVYEIKDIVNLDDDFMDAWYDSMKAEAPDVALTDSLSLDEFKKVFEDKYEGEEYANAFFLKDGGLEIGLSYHDEENGSVGWMTAPFTWDEIKTYKTDSSMWKIVGSND